MARPSPSSVRIPRPLREQLVVAAAAEQRSFSSLVVTLLDQGLAVRARERELIREMVAELDARPA